LKFEQESQLACAKWNKLAGIAITGRMVEFFDGIALRAFIQRSLAGSGITNLCDKFPTRRLEHHQRRRGQVIDRYKKKNLMGPLGLEPRTKGL